MGAEEHSIRVKIFGEEYTLKADEDPSYIRRVAQHVDSKFYEVAQGGAAVPSMRVAVLASLTIADDLLKLEGKLDKEKEEVAGRIQALTALLDRELGVGPPTPGVGKDA